MRLTTSCKNTASWQNHDGLERPALVRASTRLEMTHLLLSGKSNYDQARLKNSLDLEATGNETNQWWSPDTICSTTVSIDIHDTGI